MFEFKALRVAALASAVALVSGPALADVDIKFTLDWKFQGPTAAFLLAAGSPPGRRRSSSGFALRQRAPARWLAS